MAVPEHSRNHTARPGHQLHDAVDLPGWEDQSIWGWDEGTGSFYAQLWRNDSTSDTPDIWLTAARTPYPWPSSIALSIVEQTGVDALTVVRAMGLAHPDPTLLADEAIMDRAGELARLNDQSRYIGGQVHALAWVQGLAEFTPGTRTEWGTRKPSAAQVDAEHHMVTGRVYRGEDSVDGRDFFAGADEALWWALGR